MPDERHSLEGRPISPHSATSSVAPVTEQASFNAEANVEDFDFGSLSENSSLSILGLPTDKFIDQQADNDAHQGTYKEILLNWQSTYANEREYLDHTTQHQDTLREQSEYLADLQKRLDLNQVKLEQLQKHRNEKRPDKYGFPTEDYVTHYRELSTVLEGTHGESSTTTTNNTVATGQSNRNTDVVSPQGLTGTQLAEEIDRLVADFADNTKTFEDNNRFLQECKNTSKSAQEARDHVRVPREPHEAEHHGQAPLLGEPPVLRQAALG